MKKNKLIIKAAEIEAMPVEKKIHFLNPSAVRDNKSLGDFVGLKNIGVHLVSVEPGNESTEYHIHHYEEECIYVLSGEGTLIIEGEPFPFKKGDFVGFPANTAAHELNNTGTETLIFLVMGQRLEHDVADYPNKKKRLYRNSGALELVDHDNIVNPKTKKQ